MYGGAWTEVKRSNRHRLRTMLSENISVELISAAPIAPRIDAMARQSRIPFRSVARGLIALRSAEALCSLVGSRVARSNSGGRWPASFWRVDPYRKVRRSHRLVTHSELPQ